MPVRLLHNVPLKCKYQLCISPLYLNVSGVCTPWKLPCHVIKWNTYLSPDNSVRRDGSQMALGFHETEACPLLAYTGSSDCHTGEPSLPSEKWLRRCSAHFKDLVPYSDGVAAATSGRVCTQRDFFFSSWGGSCILSVCLSEKHPCSGTGALNKSYLFTLHRQSKWIYNVGCFPGKAVQKTQNKTEHKVLQGCGSAQNWINKGINIRGSLQTHSGTGSCSHSPWSAVLSVSSALSSWTLWSPWWSASWFSCAYSTELCWEEAEQRNMILGLKKNYDDSHHDVRWDQIRKYEACVKRLPWFTP